MGGQNLCACCGMSTPRGLVCSDCVGQGVQGPPWPRELVDRVVEALRVDMERELRMKHGPNVVVEIVTDPRDGIDRAVWDELIATEGRAGAIAAIHRARVDSGWARPLTRLLSAQQAAELFGVKPNTVRSWIRSGRLGRLTVYGRHPYRRYREDELRRAVGT